KGLPIHLYSVRAVPFDWSLSLPGSIWHGARTLFRDVFAGIEPNLDAQVEFGAFQKLGDQSKITKSAGN
ncbi:hypothetical protein HAX54_007828, partial [Datura stramonium]|nr:hypothetical protein [Datura stramonium]